MLISQRFEVDEHGTAEEKVALLRCALEHDLAEKFVGDVPRPWKSEDHEQLEQALAQEHGILHETLIPLHLQAWLRMADAIEAGQYALQEATMGNRAFVEILERINTSLRESENKLNFLQEILILELAHNYLIRGDR